MANNYQSIFADFDYDYITLGQQLGPKWADNSWKNDTCPKFSCLDYDESGVWYDIWFDYEDLTKSETGVERELGEIKRFGLTNDSGHFLLQTDDWEEMRKAIVEDNIVQKDYDKRVEADAIARAEVASEG